LILFSIFFSFLSSLSPSLVLSERERERERECKGNKVRMSEAEILVLGNISPSC
jgi:hypothetical protein